ncbi:MAG: hypothetical protein KF819_39065 [Labilithrix sp.]|nr:hypothetical protein [Labilithrix sp.]
MSALTRRQWLVGSAIASVAGIGGALAACSRATPAGPSREEILRDVVNIVIVPSYVEASVTAAALAGAAERLTPDVASLTAAREAWRAARGAWKITDAFLLGPADDLAVTGGAIDSGPPDVAKIEALVVGASVIDDAAVGSLGGNQRGFAGLEALLFDPSKTDEAVAVAFAGDRRRALAAAIARDLRRKIDAVRDAWLPEKGNFAAELAKAGRGSTRYATERQGIDAIVNAIAGAAEVLVALRLAKPLGLDVTPQAPHPELVESPLSDASLADILAVVDGIERIYLGGRGSERGAPLGDAVHELRPDGDDRLRQELTRAKNAVALVPPPLREAVSAHRDAAIAAHAAVREIKRSIVTDVAGALGTTIGFSVTDGD